MTEPEIARRCHACGASIRDRAFFCPQCGKQLKTTSELTEAHSVQGESSVAETAPLEEVQTQKEQLKAEPSSDPPAGKPTQSAKPTAPASGNLAVRNQGMSNQAGKAQAKPGAQVFAGARNKVHRATGMAKNVGGDVVQRGQKLREISSVVLDEAGVDPSLRFVLVAAVLFLMFVLIVLLNRFIT